MISRRGFLLGAVAACAGGALPWSTHARAATLRAARARAALVGEAAPPTEVWAYGGSVPGPILRYRQGERLRIELENALDAETTVHWHGIRLPNAMDGVPHVTQAPVARGGRFLYEFDLPDAGTYWYHPHLGSPEQVARGLYGALIVEEAVPPTVDRDVVWVLSDWRLDRQARVVEDFGHPRDASHAGRIGNAVTLNGRVEESFAMRAGERVRLRLVNAAAARIFALGFEGHDPWVIAHDGQPVEPHKPAGGRIVLGPGMRADLILDCIAAPGSRHRVIDDFYRRQAYRLVDLEYSTEAPLRAAQAPVPRLARNPVTLPDLRAAERHRIVFGGGMMGAIPSQREHRGLFWTVNGKPVAEHGHGNEPLLTLRRNRSYVLELVNQTSWHHPIHLHGHVFQHLSRDGKSAAPQHLADTVLLEPDSRAEIAFAADNPGDWMFHCHVLDHQASGMMALLRVA